MSIILSSWTYYAWLGFGVNHNLRRARFPNWTICRVYDLLNIEITDEDGDEDGDMG